MRLGKYLSSLTKPELEELKELLNLTEDEEMVFDLLKKGYSRERIALNIAVSPATVGNKILAINKKIYKINNIFCKNGGILCIFARLYVNVNTV